MPQEAPSRPAERPPNDCSFNTENQKSPPCGSMEVPHCRIWFARSSACVGRAYKGLEAEDLAHARQIAFEELARWIKGHPTALLDIRGCTQNGEVGNVHRRALALARCEHSLKF